MNNEIDTVIDVQSIYKCWGNFVALKNVSFNVKQGEVVAVLGPSGSGKSTLLRCINHLETINGGKIFVHGRLIGYEEKDGVLHELGDKRVSAQRASIGMVFQSFNLFRHLNALENVMLALTSVKRISKKEAQNVALSQLEWVGLADKVKNYPSQLSGGQQQRVAIARALAMQPTAILFDEPTSALDPELSQEVVSTIKKLAEGGKTMMIATHEMSIARDFADRVLFFSEGQLVEDVSAKSFFDNPQHERSRQFLSYLKSEH